MPRGKVKVKRMIQKNSAQDVHALNEMFDQLTGVSKADPEILLPKYINFREQLYKFCKVFELLTNFKPFTNNFTEFSTEIKEISDFVSEMREKLELNTSMEEETPEIKEYDKEKLNEKFTWLKETKFVQKIIITGGNLRKYKNYLNPDELSDRFIKREVGLSLTPISFSGLDLKKIWVSDNFKEFTGKFLLKILSKVAEISYTVYDIVTSPNIDIKKFSRVLIDNIGALKKQIPRCNDAFNIIANSVQMLEDNFNTYYKSSVEAENVSVIIESFIVDVSLRQKSSLKVTQQFRTIIKRMQQKSANNNDPRVKKLFSILNNQFSMMEKQDSEETSGETFGETSEEKNE